MTQLTWKYGITTCLSRNHSRLINDTVNSLARGGFETPLFFCDNLALGLGAFGNWVRAAWFLYLSNPFADRYAIFQDDIVCSRNLREFLEKSLYPQDGYLNCVLWPGNADGRAGWYEAPDHCGLGAQALVFSNEAMQILLKSHWLVDHPRDKFRGRRAIDGIVKTAMGEAGFKEFVHSPSPVKHMGAACSTLQPHKYPETAHFMGEDFDLLTCLPKEQA